MNNKKSTKRALLSSVLSLLLCLTMLIGTTFAWFTDSVTSTGNIIKAGTLDVEMYWADGTENPESTTWTDASEGAIFNYDKWEPGYVDVKHIKIENKGTLALKYALSIAAGTEVSILADVIDVYYVDGAKQVASRDDLDGMTLVGTLREAISGLSAVEGDLDAGLSDTVTIALKMKETAGNEYQGLSIGSSFSVQLLATQLEAEVDSFDKTYDAEATYLNQDENGNWIISNAAEVVYFANQVNSGNSYKDETVLLANDIDLEGINWTPIGTTSGKAFQGTFDGQGHTISNLAGVYKNTNAGKYGKAFFGNCTGDVTIKNVTFTDASIANEASPKGNIYGIVCGYSYGNITFENVHVKDSYLSGLGKVGAILAYAADPGDDVITMKNCSVTNTTIAGVYNVAPFIGLIQVGNSVEMDDCSTSDITWIANATGDYAMPYKTVSDNEEDGIYWAYSDVYNYAAWGNAYTTYEYWENGDTTMVGYCVDRDYADPAIEYKVSSAESLASALASGGNVVMTSDVDAGGQVFVNNGGVLDGNGNTLYVNSGSAAYESGLTVTEGTVKNVTVAGAFRGLGVGGSGASEMTGDATYENVTVKDATYGINIGIGNGYKLTVIDSTICDWNSYSGLGSAQFTGCTFTSEGRYYAAQRISANATFTYTNCKFEQNTYDNASGTENYYLDSYGNGTIVFENCYMGDTLITSENVNELFQISPKNNTTVKVVNN